MAGNAAFREAQHDAHAAGTAMVEKDPDQGDTREDGNQQ
jgi:hypothetical protein